MPGERAPLEIGILLLALTLDALVGEPPRPLHPVVWMGKWAELLERAAPWGRGPRLQTLYGLGMTLLVAAPFAWGAWALLSLGERAHPLAGLAVGALLLKSTFAVRELGRCALTVRRLLDAGDLPRARRELRALVGRDTSRLDRRLAASAAVESVGENLCDSVVAPLFYFALLGVPGAVAYRAVNTLDAMVGHRGRYEHLGKVPARLDDALNYIPARLAALLLVAAAFLMGKDGRGAWRALRRDASRTPSPNAGWPMSAMAGALGVELEKPGYYRLGEERRPLTPERILEAVALMAGASALAALTTLLGRLGLVHLAAP